MLRNLQEQIKDVHDLRFDPVYNVIFSRKGSSVEIKDNVLLDYDSISRKECYRYIIFKNDEFDFLLKSENEKKTKVVIYQSKNAFTWLAKIMMINDYSEKNKKYKISIIDRKYRTIPL